jgi:lysylphosphatidylglycerol synthetase-like protein (DUF2156 family)
MLGKLAAFIAFRKSSSVNSQLLQQLLTGVGAVIFLSLVGAFLASIIIAGIVYLSFNLLLEFGLSENAAMFVLGIFLILLLILLAFVILNYVHKIKVLSKRIVTTEHPMMQRANTLVDAFMDGFKGK